MRVAVAGFGRVCCGEMHVVGPLTDNALPGCEPMGDRDELCVAQAGTHRAALEGLSAALYVDDRLPPVVNQRAARDGDGLNLFARQDVGGHTLVDPQADVRGSETQDDGQGPAGVIDHPAHGDQVCIVTTVQADATITQVKPGIVRTADPGRIRLVDIGAQPQLAVASNLRQHGIDLHDRAGCDPQIH